MTNIDSETVAPERKHRVTFTLKTDVGAHVYLAGDFNNWNPLAKEMTDRRSDGHYTAVLLLRPGAYQYKFVIDGTWCADPECPGWVTNEHGTLNSVFQVE